MPLQNVLHVSHLSQQSPVVIFVCVRNLMVHNLMTLKMPMALIRMNFIILVWVPLIGRVITNSSELLTTSSYYMNFVQTRQGIMGIFYI